MSRSSPGRADSRRRRLLTQGMINSPQRRADEDSPAASPSSSSTTLAAPPPTPPPRPPAPRPAPTRSPRPQVSAALASPSGILAAKAVCETLPCPTPVMSAGLLTVQRLLGDSRPVTWVFTGDNMAQGAQYTTGSRNLAEHFGERVRCELRRCLDVVINTGISGDTVSRLLKSAQWRIVRYHAEVVHLTVGMNDSKAGQSGRESFRADLRGLLDLIRGEGAVPVIHTPNGVHPVAVSNRRDLPAYVEILREEAERVELPLVDHWEHWRRIHEKPEAVARWLGDGRLQPNQFGHREMAKLLFHAFNIFDPASPSCRWEVP